MSQDFYPIPPSFGALMKRQGGEHHFVEEARQLSSYRDLLRRFSAKEMEQYQIVKKILLEKRIIEFAELTRQVAFEDFVNYLLEGTVIDKIDVETAIRQNIMLYLATKPGDYSFDRTYGCLVHHYDFRQLNETPSRDLLKRSIVEYLQKFEKRINVTNASIDINDVHEVTDGESARVCRYITITISGVLIQTQQPLKDMKFRLVRYS